MAYEKKISRANPGHILFVLDNSGSMSDRLPGTSDAKSRWVEKYIEIFLRELVARSTGVKGQAIEVKPRYFITTILYGGSPQLWGTPMMDVQATVEKYTRAGNSLGLSGSMGGTNAAAALDMALQYVEQSLKEERFQDSFAPVVFHLTDGMSQSDATPVAERTKQLRTADGNCLMINAYIGCQTNLAYKGPEDFPGYVDVREVGASEDNIRMFKMSSVVPESMRSNLVKENIFPNLRAGARFFFDVRTKELLKHTIQAVGSMESRAAR